MSRLLLKNLIPQSLKESNDEEIVKHCVDILMSIDHFFTLSLEKYDGQIEVHKNEERITIYLHEDDDYKNHDNNYELPACRLLELYKEKRITLGFMGGGGGWTFDMLLDDSNQPYFEFAKKSTDKEEFISQVKDFIKLMEEKKVYDM